MEVAFGITFPTNLQHLHLSRKIWHCKRSSRIQFLSTSTCSNLRVHSVHVKRSENERRHAVIRAVSSEVSDSTSSAVNSGSMVIVANGLFKSHDGERVQLDDVSFQIAQGSKIGVVGLNGCGKSTLLSILAGTDQPDSGSYWFKKGIRVGFVDQEEVFDESYSVLEAIFNSDTQVVKLLGEYEALLKKIEKSSDENEAIQLGQQLAKVTEKMDAAQAWDIEALASKILTSLGISNFDQKVAELSGGMKKRVSLASALIQRPELLVLDEPTNHLDIDTISWLEEFLMDPALTVVCVTHDRSFLDRVCSQIYELDRGSLYVHEGNYESFLTGKEARLVAQEKIAQDAKVRLRKEAEWMRRQPKARQAKSKSRIDNFYALQEQSKLALGRKDLQLSVSVSRMGDKVLNVKNASLAFDNRVILDRFSYDFLKGDRIGICGRSGIGKSTFLQIISQRQQLDSGEVDVGETIRFGFYEQQGIQIPGDLRVMEYVNSVVQEHDFELTGLQLLERFQFQKAHHFTFIDRLSGGEKRRLQLLTVLAKNPNFLVLDEVTNDLDLETVEVLEDFLMDYTGVLVIVSHDRIFMDRLTNHLFVFEGDGIVKDFQGTFTEYLEFKRTQELKELSEAQASRRAEEQLSWSQQKSDSSARSKAEVKTSDRKLSYNERREYNRIEGEIEKLQEKVDEVNIKLADTSLGYSELSDYTEQLAELTASIDSKTERWMELAEIAGE